MRIDLSSLASRRTAAVWAKGLPGWDEVSAAWTVVAFCCAVLGDRGLDEPFNAPATSAGERIGSLIQPIEIKEGHADGIEQETFVAEGCALAVWTFERVAVYVHGVWGGLALDPRLVCLADVKTCDGAAVAAEVRVELGCAAQKAEGFIAETDVAGLGRLGNGYAGDEICALTFGADAEFRWFGCHGEVVFRAVC